MGEKQYALKWLIKKTKSQLWRVAFLSVFSGCISLGFVGLALVSKYVLEVATGDTNGSLAIGILGVAVIIALQAAFNVIYANIGVRAAGKIDMALKRNLFNNVLGKKWFEVSKYHTGELLNRATSDIEVITNGVINIVPEAIALGTRLVAGLAVLIFINARFTLIVMGFGVVVFFASKIYSKHFKYLHKLCQESDGVVRSFLQECMANLVVIKSFSKNEAVCDKLNDRQLKSYRLKIKRNTVSNIANTGVYVLFTGSYYIALVWGALQISIGSLTFGSLTAFLQIIDQIKAPMKNISGLIPQYYSMIASVERLMEIESIEDEVCAETGLSIQELYDEFESLNVEGVSFSYKDDLVLENATTVINKGELVAIAGPSGVGKSTLIKLFLALIEVDSGEVYIKTKKCKLSIDSGVRKLFSYVPQGNMILSGSIRENVAFCTANATDEEILNACEVAMLKNFILELPEGLDTMVGERGLGLSEGQVQRLAIARAILSGAPILLLDEATSALDEATEVGLLKNLKNLKDKTCIFISHKQTTIDMCNRVIHMKDKKLI